ncbi:hypothetical protein T4B_3647 [Trichinella pseudospiralis]|uniref:Uncharacterized protein n=1 Tax=Trichinella pseudospiralis TaxID=6337 RepID=A0A0V1ICQ0_TRIPS|nr:hypothetical protein T4B_3647 [Trichinella pseudospiralis]
MYLSAAQQKSDGMRVSCSISLLIAKTISLHTIYKGLIFSCYQVLHTALHKPSTDIIKKIILSDNTVQPYTHLCDCY